MTDTWCIPQPPDDLTRVLDGAGRVWEAVGGGEWRSDFGEYREWDELLLAHGPVTRAPRPDVTIPAARLDAAALDDVLERHAASGECAARDFRCCAEAVRAHLLGDTK